MQVVNLATQEARFNFFSNTLVIRTRTLVKGLIEHKDDVRWFDGKEANIVRGASLGLDLSGDKKFGADAWRSSSDLIDHTSPMMERRGRNLSNWVQILKRSLLHAKGQGDIERQIALHHHLARLQLRRGEYEDSTANYEQVIQLSEDIGDSFTKARACTNLGYHYIESGDWSQAEDLCRQALKLFEAISSDHGLAHAHNHLGILYIRQHKWHNAEHHLALACETWDGMHDTFGLMYGYMNLGLLYNEMVYTSDLRDDQTTRALEFSNTALRHAESVGDKLSQATICQNIGITYWLAGQLKDAIDYSKRAEVIFRNAHHSIRLAQVLNNQGLIYLDQEEWDDAVDLLYQSLELFESLEIVERTIKLKLDLADCWLRVGEIAETQNLLGEINQFIQKHGYKQYYHYLVTRYKKIRQNLDKALAN